MNPGAQGNSIRVGTEWILRNTRPDYCTLEEPVIIVGIEHIHQLHIDIVFRLSCPLGMNETLVVIMIFMGRVAAVTEYPPAVIYHAALAQWDAANRTPDHSTGTRMKVTLQWSHPLLRHHLKPKNHLF